MLSSRDILVRKKTSSKEFPSELKHVSVIPVRKNQYVVGTVIK
jgi:hypothetical protein